MNLAALRPYKFGECITAFRCFTNPERTDWVGRRMGGAPMYSTEAPERAAPSHLGAAINRLTEQRDAARADATHWRKRYRSLEEQLRWDVRNTKRQAVRISRLERDQRNWFRKADAVRKALDIQGHTKEIDVSLVELAQFAGIYLKLRGPDWEEARKRFQGSRHALRSKT